MGGAALAVTEQRQRRVATRIVDATGPKAVVPGLGALIALLLLTGLVSLRVVDHDRTFVALTDTAAPVSTAAPPTTAAPTTMTPPTTPPTTVPPTTAPPTTAAPSTIPPTTAAPVTAPPTTRPRPGHLDGDRFTVDLQGAYDTSRQSDQTVMGNTISVTVDTALLGNSINIFGYIDLPSIRPGTDPTAVLRGFAEGEAKAFETTPTGETSTTYEQRPALDILGTPTDGSAGRYQARFLLDGTRVYLLVALSDGPRTTPAYSRMLGSFHLKGR